ncbi:MAG: 16S rRNA (cytidine(1402)-2'-O)-methyltransferase [Anaerolineaceae bacterium]|nr:MAG: 16S rRNA (cytidine(1402)-2'-O)-methyltransferase [Anaerolineaceae bacterium]
MPTLFIVPTPIGNLEDITLRALRVLKDSALIAAEDTRTSRVLLNHYDINTPMTSYHEHNKLDKLDAMLSALAGGDVALISDAGTPGISDPGYELIRAAIDAGYRVEPLPGANAIIPALVASGLPADRFMYVGFIPKKAKARAAFLHDLADQRGTIIAYESPHRLVDTLDAIAQVMGAARAVCVAREISKAFEEFRRGTCAEVRDYYAANPPRGEITVLIDGATPDSAPWSPERVREALRQRLEGGESRRDAARAIAGLAGWSKREVYALDV